MAARTLIIGADSLIGKALHARLQSRGCEVIGTTRRPAESDAARVHLDLSNDPASWPDLPTYDAMVICAAVNGFAACRRSPEHSRWVNVEAAEALARRAFERGAWTVFLSSSAVFDGSRAFAEASDPVSPQTEYGRQKAEAERRLLALGGPVTVLRLTKVVWSAMPLLGAWQRALTQGEPIKPYADLSMAPLALDWVSGALARTIERRLTGIVQLSAAQDVTYHQVAQWLARELGAKPDLIHPWSAREAGVPAAERPSHTTLDMCRERRELMLEPPAACGVIEALFRQPRG